MSRHQISTVTFILMFAGIVHAEKAETIEEIQSIFDVQAKAWNDGDLDTFMSFYWKSPELTFSSGGSTTRGWQATLDRYRTRYPSKELMGEVKFSQIEITLLGADAALILGRWQLKREAGDKGGNFTLAMRRIENEWKIIHDHTSLSVEE